jgi:hypothetical protein
VNKRTITWLVALLMTLAAGAATPVPTGRVANSGVAVVWILQKTAEQRVLGQAQRVAAGRVSIALTYQSASPRRPFASSLYQRPPPFLL